MKPCVLVFLFCSTVAIQSIAAPQYTISVLEPIVGAYRSSAVAINNADYVTGSSHFRAYPYRAATRWVGDIPSQIFYGNTVPQNMSENAKTVGFVFRPEVTAYLESDGSVTYLPYLTGFPGSIALAVNDSGVVVGEARKPTSGNTLTEAVVWRNGTVERLDDLHNEIFEIFRANSINNSGTAVGSGMRTDIQVNQQAYAIDLNTGQLTNLGELVTTHPYAFTRATDINQSGQVVGFASGGDIPGNGRPQLAIWQDGVGELKGPIGERLWGHVAAINNLGDVAGYAFCDGDWCRKSYIWTHEEMHPFYELLVNPGGWDDDSLKIADINDRGQVVGVGIFNGTEKGFIASPIKAPVVIEAESMTLKGGYAVEDNAAASGGQLIRRLDSGGRPATASTQYTGAVGNYDIAVSYFDESDGRSSLVFLVNGQPLEQWIADEDPACRDCASPGASTLRTRVVARDIRLSPGDEITLQGTGDDYEYARFDKITIAPVSSTTLEAEMMTLKGGYAVEGNAAASGGQLIRRLDSGGYAASASTEFAGLAGAYDITVSYFDENDGMSSLAFFLNGEISDQWVADEDPSCRDCASPVASTLRTRLVAKEMRLVPGDVIALQGTGEHYEYARFDKITLAPVGFTTLEAEMMTLDESFVVEANAAASGGQLIRGNGPADSVTGNANAAFMGSQGTYDITVTYFDEYDGISSMAFFLNGQLLDRWLADENPACRDCASPNERTLRSRVVATAIEISPGDEIRLESSVNQYEYGRFDKIDFTLSLSP